MSKSRRKTTQSKELEVLNSTLLEENGLPVEEKERLKRHFHPKTLSGFKFDEKRQGLLKLIDDNDITIIKGQPGTGKTYLACYYILKALEENKFDKIILTKPIQEAGENLGFLPGTVEEKIAPYIESFKYTLIKFVGQTFYDRMIAKGVIEYRPLAYMRGITFENCLVLGDEFQNANIAQIMTFVTRMGKDSKVILCGDTNQSDIKATHVGLPAFENMVKDINGVGIFSFGPEDNKRNPILIEITTRYERLKAEGHIPKAHNS